MHDDPSRMLSRLLIDNHLAFLAAHRGQIVQIREEAFECKSEKKSFAMTFVLSVKEALAAADQARLLYVPSWIHAKLDGVLGGGYEEAYSLAYMARQIDARTQSEVASPAAFEVREGRTPDSIDDFAAVQIGGFCETRESRDALSEWMRAADQRNQADPRQRFFVGYSNGEPVTCALVLDAASIAGIFAVATLPDKRRRSFSRALMQSALADAYERGFGLTGLSVIRGSVAEQCYLRLGYRPVFRMHILTPRAPKAS